jgi:hypothetical protein
MRLTITLLISLMISFGATSQTLLFSENFETNSLPDSVNHTGNGNWGKSSTLYSQGTRSDSLKINAVGDSIVSTTFSFSTTGNSFVMLHFDHICKIEFFDEAYIEVSNNNGTTWTRLTGAQYQGISQFATQGNKFTAAAYAIDWAAGSIAVPSNAWWKSEVFDISLLVGNAPNVLIRFILKDALMGNTMPDNYAWFIDNIRVIGAFSELNPPILTMLPPIVQDTVYSTGPYMVRAHITDQSLVDTAYVVYWVNVGAPDTIGMTRLLADTFRADIPFFGFGKNIHYYVVAIDGSAAHNVSTSQTYSFYCKFSTGGTFTLGTGTSFNTGTGYPTPYGNYYYGSKEQYLIRASEMTALGMPGGPISSIAFNVSNVNACPGLTGYYIKMAHTPNTALSSFITSGLTTVYNTTSYQPVNGWNTHTFQTPFVWNGVDNVLIEVCFNNSSYPSNGNASVLYSSTPFSATLNFHTDNTTVCSAPGTPTSYQSRPNMIIEILGVTSLTLDAGVGQMVYPTGGVIANTPFDVKVKVKNYGTDTLSSATVNWRLNGVLQTPYSWTGSLLKDSLSTDVTLGNITLPMGVHSIVAWTDNPNGQPDLNTGNDSAKIDFMACASLLAGNYTIGGTNPDFIDFTAALIALEQCGINAPVVFNVASGTYAEQLNIPFISGTSTINTITFQAATGDSTDVVLQYNSTVAGNNYTVRFNGTSNIIFKKMTIKALNTTNGRAVVIAGGANNNLITNCELIGVVNSVKSTDALRAVVFSGGDVDNNNTIASNRIVDGEHGIFLLGTALVKETGTIITGNELLNQIITGITVTHQAAPFIKANYVNAINQVDGYRGIYVTYSNGAIQVLANNVVIRNALSARGLEMAECASTASDPGMIANNMASINLWLTGTNAMYPCGLTGHNSSHQRFWYNSVNMYGTSTQPNAAFRFSNNASSSGIDLLNNNFVNHITGGILLNFEGTTLSAFTSNYNNLYAENGGVAYMGVNYATLSAWQTFSSKDLNSFVIKPYFNSNTDLHTYNGLLNGLATPVPEVTVDIDGQVRHLITPDPGADEFDPPAIDVAVLEIIDPIGGCRMDSTEAVTIMIKNTGTNAVTSGLAANFRFNHSSTVVTENITTPILSGDTLIYTFNATVNMNVYALGVADTFNLKVWTTLTGDPVPYNDSLEADLPSLYTPLPPQVSNVAILYSAAATLNAISPDTVLWYATDTSSVELHQGATYTTPPLFGNTTYWVAATTGAVQSSGPYTPGPNIAPLATASASNCSTGPCSTLNDLNLGTCGTQQMWISTSTPPSATPHVDWIDFEWLTPVTIDGMKIHHAQNTARFLTGATMYKWENGAWVSFHTFSNLPMQCENQFPFPMVTTNKLRLTSFQMTGTGQLSNPNFREIEIFEGKPLGCESVRVPVVVTVGPPPPDDAGIAQVVFPVVSAPSGQPHQIKVMLKNFGLDTLTNVKIYWSLNTVLQDSVYWTGLLLQDSTEIVTIDTAMFAGGAYCMKSWTSMPNGVLDIIPLNDTATSCFNACMSGVYTIGPAASGTYDFNTFNAALNTLIASGICGHVIFDVHPGTYNEQLTIPSINGMDANNTVTFRSFTGDSTSVTLQYTSSSTTDNWTVRLNDADWFRFERLTLRALNTTNGRVVEMINGAHYNRFEGNRLITAGTSSTTTSCVYDGSTLNHYNTYLNNYMEGGYYTMYIYGISTASWQKGTVIQGNVIEGSYYYPMNCYYLDSVQIIGNKITSTLVPYSYGISAYYLNNKYRIVGNDIKITGSGSSISYGIRDYYCNYFSYNANPTGYGLVANNMISISGSTAGHYGLYAYYSNGTEYYYNSVSITGGSATYYSLYQANTTSNTLGQKFVNNIFSNTVGGYAAYFATPASVTVCDYNNYYTSASNFVYWGAAYPNLAALQAASGKDANSHNLIPPFNATHDLHLANTLLSAKATPIAAITTDIDGDPRSLLPTIGADEIPLLPNDAGVIAISSPGILTNEGQTYPVTVTVANFGTDPIYTMDIMYSVNNGAPVTYQYNDTLLSAATAVVSLPSMISPAGNSVICAKTSLLNDSNFFNDEFCKTFFGTPVWDARTLRFSGLENACNIGLDTISVWVRNLGVNAINSPTSTNITMSYKIDNLTPVTQNFTQVLMPGDSVLFHFTTLADFSVTTATDTFAVMAWVTLQGDNVQYNDTIKKSVISFHVPASPVVTPATVPYASPATLTASSPTNDPILWYNTPTGGSSFHTGTTYTTPILYTNTTYYLESSTLTLVPGSFLSPNAFVGGNSCGGGFMIDITALTSDITITALDMNLTASGAQTVPFFYRVGTWQGFANNQSAWIPWGTYSVNSPGTNQATNMVINPLTIPQGMTYSIYWQVGSAYATLSTNATYTNGDISVLSGMAHCTNWDGCCTPRGWNGRIYYNKGGFGCGSPRVPLQVTVSAPAAADVGVSQILQPTTAVNLGATETVIVKVKNYGTAAQSNIPVSFKVDNQTTVTETIAGPLAPGDSLNYTFVGKANLALVGNTYQMKAWTSLAADNTHLNDTAWKTVQNLFPSYCISTATSPAYEDLTNVTLHTLNNTSAAVGSMYTNFSATVPPPVLSPGMSYPISISSGFPPSYSYQYNCWVKAWIDFDRDGTFDPVNEMIFSSATTSSNTVTGTVSIPPTAMSGNTLMRVVFVETSAATSVNPCGTYTWGETEDYMITISPQGACDAGITAIVEPGGTTAAGAVLPIKVVVMNFGSDPIAPGTLSITYTINNGTPVVVPYPGGLPSMGKDTVTLGNMTAVLGYNTLCVKSILACDTITFNDEKCVTVFGNYATNVPYFDDFEGPNYWYKPDASTNWQYGTPAANIINTAYSGTKSWVTKLAGNYTDNANEHVYSPIFDFTGLSGTDTVTLSFYHWQDMQSGDYGRVQYSTDGGTNWSNLGFFQDTYGTNWYNVTSGGLHYFSTMNTGWQYSAYKLLPGTFNIHSDVRFRFNFVSNTSGNGNGWAIDNFKLSLPMVPNDVGVSAINYPINDTAIGSVVYPKVTITNFGSNPQVMFPVVLKLNGAVVATETWTGNLPSLGTTTYTFLQPFTVPSANYQLCAETQLSGDAFAVNNGKCQNFAPQPAYHDVGIVKIVQPLPDSVGNICFYHAQAQPWYQYQVIVKLHNPGQNTQTSVPVKYTFSTGGTVHSDTWTGTIAHNDTVDVVLTNLFLPALGAQQLCVEADLTGDPVTANNKTCLSFTGKACIGIDDPMGSSFELYQNVPNPADGRTMFAYRVPHAGDVTFGIVSLLGQVLHSDLQTVSAGEHQFELDLSNLAAGVYYYFVEYNGQRLTKKLVIRN